MGSEELRTFDGSVSVVTGGASGIGRALSYELSRRGSEVVLADIQMKMCEEVAEAIRLSGGHAHAREVDVTDYAAIKKLLNDTQKEYGRIDYVFNNAGMGVGGPLALHSMEEVEQVIDVNLRGVVNGVQAAYMIMIRQGFGHIVNTASMAGLLPLPGMVTYAAAKHAVVGLSKSLRVEAALEGVRVSVLCPGVVRTSIMTGGKHGRLLMEISPERRQELEKRLWPMEPDVFAKKVLDAVAKNRAIIIIPSWWRIFWWIGRLSPMLGLKLSDIFYRRSLKEFETK